MNIKLQKTDKVLSSNGGLPILEKLVKKNLIRQEISPHLPTMKIAKHRSINKFEGLLYGFAAGAECLDDLEFLANDAGLSSVVKRTFSATTYGDYLRDFSQADLKGLSFHLNKLIFSTSRMA